MNEKTKNLILCAASALLVSCGGGGNSDTSAGTSGAGSTTAAAGSAGTTPSAPATPTTPTTPATATTPTAPTTPAAGTGVATGSTTGAASGTGTSPPVVAPAPDKPFNGYLEIVADQVMYIRMNRVIYLPVTLGEFLSDRGIVDVAPGSKTDHVDIVLAGTGCDVAIDGTCGIQPMAAGPAAPMAAFAIRVDKVVQPNAAGQTTASQTSVGRIAIDLAERPDSPGIPGGETAESMRFVIDRVELTTDQNGALASARLQDGAVIHVVGRNAAGVELREDIPAPANTVRLLPISAGPDSNGDTTSVYLYLDLETGFSRAGTKLAALENIAGQFSMRLTISNASKLGRKASGGADLIGETITVSGQPPVSGAGFKGNAWIRMYPLK